MKYDKMSVESLQKYMKILCRSVNGKILLLWTDKLLLYIDRWMHGNTHYVGRVASYATYNNDGYGTVLLGLAPADDETSLGWYQHVYLIKCVLSVSKKSNRNVIELIEDSVSVNKSIAGKIVCRLVGCASNRFSIPVNYLISEHDGIFTSVHAVMEKLCNFLAAVKLREFTSLKLVLNRVTPWTPTHYLLRRYKENREFILKRRIQEVTLLMPRNYENVMVETWLQKMSQLNSIIQTLNLTNDSIADSRNLLDAV